jgi:hypothetical protein
MGKRPHRSHRTEESIVASVEAVEAALTDLAGRLDGLDVRLRRTCLPSRRSVEAHVVDLELRYHAVWEAGVLGPVTPGPAPPQPDIRLGATSDDLLALVEGELGLPTAYATGRLELQAPMVDLLRLTALW